MAFFDRYTKIEFRLIDLDGVVLTNAGDFIEVEEPKDYESTNLVLERITNQENIPRHGFNFSYGDPETPIVFIKASGYQLLQDIYDLKGNDAQVKYQFIATDTRTNTEKANITYFLDFNTYSRKWENGQPRIEVTVINQALSYKIKSRYESVINLLDNKDLDGNSITPLEMDEHYWHGKVIEKNSEFTGNTTDFRYFDGAREYRDNKAFFVAIPYTLVTNEIGASTFKSLGIFEDEGDMDGFFHFNAPDDGKYRIQYKNSPSLLVDFYNNNSDGTDVVLDFCYKIGEAGTINVLQSERGTVGTGNVFYTNYGSLSSNGRVVGKIYDIDTVINLQKDDNLYLFYRYQNDPDSNDITPQPRRREFAFIGTGSVNGAYIPFLKVTAETAPATTLVNSIDIFDFNNRMLEIISGQTDILLSDFYSTGCGAKRWLTNGYQLRNFETDLRPPETTMEDLIDALTLIDDIGWGYELDNGEVKIRMEESNHFYKDAEILKIDSKVIRYEEMIADELIINQIVLQFNEYIEEELNTLDAFTTKAEYLTPIKTKFLKLELFCEFIADAYSIEYTRRQQFEETPNDSWRYDNNIFIVDWVEITGLIGGSKPNRLNYQSNVFIGDDSTVTLPIIIPELVDLMLISWTPITGPDAGNLTEYTVDSVVFNETNSKTIITVNETTTQQAGNTEFIFGGGFSFKRPESDQNFSTVNNLISPSTTYNLRMSMKRLLLKHAKWLNSGLNYKESTEVIQNTFLDHNKTLQTQFRDGETCLGGDLNRILLSENEDIALSDFGNFARYFIPLRIEYEAELSFTENEYLRNALNGQSIDDNNYGYISVLNEDAGFTKIYVNQHIYKPYSSTIQGWVYKKYDN